MSIPACTWGHFLSVPAFIQGNFTGLHMLDGRRNINFYLFISLSSRNHFVYSIPYIKNLAVMRHQVAEWVPRIILSSYFMINCASFGLRGSSHKIISMRRPCFNTIWFTRTIRVIFRSVNTLRLRWECFVRSDCRSVGGWVSWMSKQAGHIWRHTRLYHIAPILNPAAQAITCWRRPRPRHNIFEAQRDYLEDGHAW